MSKYTHTFFNWWDPVDLKDLKDKLSPEYRVEYHKDKGEETEVKDISIHRDTREEIEIESDNMTAFLSKFRATLSQTSEKKITQKDLNLRDKIRAYYPRDRPTPFPWSFNPEPELKVE